MKSPTMLVIGGVLVVTATMGCVRREKEVVYVREPQPERVVYVESAPPPPVIVEVVPERPSEEYIWVQGGWNHEGKHWVWHKGRYDRGHGHEEHDHR